MSTKDDSERIKQLVKDNRLSDAHKQVASLLASTPGDRQLDTETLQVICSLIKALALSGNHKAVDETLLATIKHVAPSDDHLFLTMSDEFIEQSTFSPLNKQENSQRLDKLFDQALKIRKGLIGADPVAAELIIESIFANLQKARQCANASLSAEAAARLARCRVLMAELEGLMLHLKNPESLLVGRVATLVSFFAHSAGKSSDAKAAYVRALEAYAKVANNQGLERNEILDMFIDQAPLFNLTKEQKLLHEKIKRQRSASRAEATQHKIKAFPSIEHIQEIMKRAAAKPNKVFSLTSLGFLGSQSLMVSVVCQRDSGEMAFTIEPSAGLGVPNKTINLQTTDAHEVLRHIKDLWKSLQSRPTGFGTSTFSGLVIDQLLLSPLQASPQDMGSAGGEYKALGSEFKTGRSDFNQPGSDFNKDTKQYRANPSEYDAVGSEFKTAKPDSKTSNTNISPNNHTTGGAQGNQSNNPYDRPMLLGSDVDFNEENRHRETLIFEGNLKTMPSLGLLQTISLNGNTGVLEVSGRDGLISIYFDAGKPIHAVSIRDSGMDLLYDFVMQEEGWFRFIPERRAPMVSIKLRFESFLLDAATLFDENKYLKSLGLTMYSGLFAKRFCSDRDELAAKLERKGIELDNDMWELYIALSENPIVTNAVDLADLPKRNWIHALYKLVQSGTVNVSNDGLDDEELSHRLETAWTYDKHKVQNFTTSLSESNSGLLRFEFMVWLLEREFERARTQMWPLSFMVFEVRKNATLYSNLSAADKATVQNTIKQISEAKRSIDWFGHLEDDLFAFIMPGLDSNLAAMFAKNFVEICSRSLGKLKDSQSDWDYSFGIASVPQDTFEWQKMVGFACEAQRKARVSRAGYITHALSLPPEDAPDESKEATKVAKSTQVSQ